MLNNLKIEDFKLLFNCNYCTHLLEKPVALPCGITICECHLDKAFLNDCKFCGKCHHQIDYQVNEKLNRMLELKVNEIKLSPSFNECKRVIEHAKLSAVEITSVAKDPDNYIYEYFEKIKHKVDLNREELKLKIDNYSDEVIAGVNGYQADCIQLAKGMDLLSVDIEQHQIELGSLIDRFDSFEISDSKYDDILGKVNVLRWKLEDVLNDLRYKLTDYKDYKFVNGNRSMDKILGSLVTYSMKV